MSDTKHLHLEIDTTPPGPGEWAEVAELVELGDERRETLRRVSLRGYEAWHASGLNWHLEERADYVTTTTRSFRTWDELVQAAVDTAFRLAREVAVGLGVRFRRQ